MSQSAEESSPDEQPLNEVEIAQEIERRERLMLRWPLLVGTSAVLYGSLMVIYIIIRLLSFLSIYMLLADLPPSGPLLFAQIFPIIEGFLLGGMLFIAGIITLRRRLLGPKLLNLWSFLMLGAIVLTLFLRLQTLPDFVSRQMLVYNRILDQEALIAEQADPADPAQQEASTDPMPPPALAEEQLASEASQFFVAFAIMGACGPAFFWFILNIPRVRRTWVTWH